MVYYLSEKNIEKNFKSGKIGDFFFCKKDFPKELIDKYNKYNIPVFINDEEYPRDLIFDNYQILFFQKKDEKGVYRRTKLLNFLRKKFKVMDIYISDLFSAENISIIKEILKAKPVIVFSSDIELPNFSLNDLNECKIIYDKYDSSGKDESLQKIADLSIASSYEILENELKFAKEKIYIPNGCDVQEYKKVDKYIKKTAVYTGYNLRKVDFNILALLKAVNSDWNFKIYGDENLIKSLELKEKYPDLEFCGFLEQSKLIEELSKCHLGLNLIDYTDDTKGQLSDKFFNYCNAHIPTLIYEEFKDNYRDYEKLTKIFDFSELSLDKYIEEKIPVEEYNKVIQNCDWNKRFEKMLEYL